MLCLPTPTDSPAAHARAAEIVVQQIYVNDGVTPLPQVNHREHRYRLLLLHAAAVVGEGSLSHWAWLQLHRGVPPP